VGCMAYLTQIGSSKLKTTLPACYSKNALTMPTQNLTSVITEPFVLARFVQIVCNKYRITVSTKQLGTFLGELYVITFLVGFRLTAVVRDTTYKQ